MNFKNEKCPKCGKINTILPSNNPLVPGVCNYCITSNLDYNKVEHGDFFARTYNLPFNPDKWIELVRLYKEDTFKEYISWVAEDNKETLYYQTKTADLWKKLDEEWRLTQTHEELINRIIPIKEAYLLRNRIKWGSNYTFEELISLENLFVNTLNANDVSNPMQIDAIKKACKMSIALDRAIISGDSKEINELSKAYQNFVKTAKIDEIITAASKDVISNVAELVDFIEKSGFQFTYYDDVARDIVDKSINDIKEYLKRLVLDATGLEVVFEGINAALKKEDAIQADAASYEVVPLEQLYQSSLNKNNDDFDEELEKEEFQEIDEEDLETNELFGN